MESLKYSFLSVYLIANFVVATVFFDKVFTGVVVIGLVGRVDKFLDCIGAWIEFDNLGNVEVGESFTLGFE